MNFKGILLIICVMCAGIYTLTNGFYQYISYSIPETVKNTEYTLNIKGNDEPAALTEIKTPEANEASSGSSTTDSVTAGSEGQAVGKITAKTISPYSANTSYNKVYLKNNTSAKIDLKGLLDKNLSFKIEKNSDPQVLIMHTHTTESYMTSERDYYTADDASRSREADKNMIAIGNIIEEKLREAGIAVIHDTAVHDYPSYSGSYTRSAATVSSDLKAYPSIKIVIDIHRDAISGDNNEKIKPVVEIDGESAAQVMLVMGSQTGEITNHPNWQENLSLAVKYQQTMEVMYPSLARAITLNSAKYNQNLTKGSILLEVGTDANTLEEAKNGAEAAGNALVSLLNTLK